MTTTNYVQGVSEYFVTAQRSCKFTDGSFVNGEYITVTEYDDGVKIELDDDSGTNASIMIPWSMVDCFTKFMLSLEDELIGDDDSISMTVSRGNE